MTAILQSGWGSIFSAQGTGSAPTAAACKTITVGFDQYEVVLAVTEDDRVLGIVEVRVKKDFRNIQQKVASTGYIDLEQFVKE